MEWIEKEFSYYLRNQPPSKLRLKIYEEDKLYKLVDEYEMERIYGFETLENAKKVAEIILADDLKSNNNG